MKKTCGIYLINKNGNLLILHPTNASEFGSWSIPKGEPDEKDGSFLDTAIRETFEETGIKINTNIPYYLSHVFYKSKKKVLYSFLIIDNDLDDVDVVCNSYINLNGFTFPENDNYLWVHITSTNLYKYLHEEIGRAHV